MTDILKAAAEALAALDNATDAQSNPARRDFPTIHDFGQCRRAADALRAALAKQPQPQPVALSTEYMQQQVAAQMAPMYEAFAAPPRPPASR